MKLKLTVLSVLNVLFSFGQSIPVIVESDHTPAVQSKYENHPLLAPLFQADSNVSYIVVFTQDCSDFNIIADSLTFVFWNKVKLEESIGITIIPDALTTFSSYYFATYLYEGCEVRKKPKKRNKPIFEIEETDEFSSIHFLNQAKDRKGQIWYYVEFTCIRHPLRIDPDSGSAIYSYEESTVSGWIKRGRTRFGVYNFGCNIV